MSAVDQSRLRTRNPLNCWSTGTHYCCHSPGDNFPSCVPKILVKHSGGVVADQRTRPGTLTIPGQSSADSSFKSFTLTTAVRNPNRISRRGRRFGITVGACCASCAEGHACEGDVEEREANPTVHQSYPLVMSTPSPMQLAGFPSLRRKGAR